MNINVATLKRALKELKKTTLKDSSSDFSRCFFSEGRIFTKDGLSSSSMMIECDLEFNVNFIEFNNFINSLDSKENVNFSFENGVVNIKSLNSEINMDHCVLDITFETTTYENVIEGEITISNDIFDAIDKNNPKLELNGLLLDFKANNIVSTNTKVLTIKPMLETELEVKIIIPKYVLNKNSTLKNVSFDGRFITFTDSNIERNVALIDGRFPEYHRIVPKSFRRDIKINGNELKQKLKKMVI